MALDGNDDPQIVEVFARFGRAMYMANVVDDSLVRTLMQVNFMKTKEAFIKAQGNGYDRAKLSADWDAYEKQQRDKTMGQLGKLVTDSPEFNEALKKRIDEARDRRNFLAHHYWREQAFTMQTTEGREKMIADLISDTDKFENLATDIHDAMKPTRAKLGIKEQDLNAAVQSRMAETRARLSLT
jgi:hypothetical protein